MQKEKCVFTIEITHFVKNTISNGGLNCVVLYGGKEIGRTEYLEQENSIHFEEKITMDVSSSEKDDHVEFLLRGERNQLVAECKIKLKNLLKENEYYAYFHSTLEKGKHAGILKVHTVVRRSHVVLAELGVSQLTSPELFYNLADPFIRISKSGKVLAETKHQERTLMARFPPIEVDTTQIDDENEIIDVQVFDYCPSGNHDLIGSFSGPFNEVFKKEEVNYVLSKNNQPNGYLHVHKLNKKNQRSIHEYLKRKSVIKAMVGIDFSAMNGFIKMPDSLHAPNSNAYENTIRLIHELMQQYSKNNGKKSTFSLYGIGAKTIVEENWVLSNCIQLYEEEKSNIDDAIKAYREASENMYYAHSLSYQSVIQKGIEAAKDNSFVELFILTHQSCDPNLHLTMEQLEQIPDNLSIQIIGIDLQNPEVFQKTCEKFYRKKTTSVSSYLFDQETEIQTQFHSDFIRFLKTIGPEPLSNSSRHEILKKIKAKLLKGFKPCTIVNSSIRTPPTLQSSPQAVNHGVVGGDYMTMPTHLPDQPMMPNPAYPYGGWSGPPPLYSYGTGYPGFNYPPPPPPQVYGTPHINNHNATMTMPRQNVQPVLGSQSPFSFYNREQQKENM